MYSHAEIVSHTKSYSLSFTDYKNKYRYSLSSLGYKKLYSIVYVKFSYSYIKTNYYISSFLSVYQ